MLKITEIHGKCDDYATYGVRVERDGKTITGFSAYPCLPEDAILERDLKFAYDAVRFFKIGLAAGLSGEAVEYVTETDDD